MGEPRDAAVAYTDWPLPTAPLAHLHWDPEIDPQALKYSLTSLFPGHSGLSGPRPLASTCSFSEEVSPQRRVQPLHNSSLTLCSLPSTILSTSHLRPLEMRPCD